MKPKCSEYVKFTFADLRRAEEIDILENAFAEICYFFERGRACYSASQAGDQNINKKHLKNWKILKFPRWNILLDQVEATKDIIDQNSANQNDPKPRNFRHLQSVT